MTKADIVKRITTNTGIDRETVLIIVEQLMAEIKTALESNKNVYFRGFGSFIVKQRAEKLARNISKNTSVIVPAHAIPLFKPADVFEMIVKQIKV